MSQTTTPEPELPVEQRGDHRRGRQGFLRGRRSPGGTAFHHGLTHAVFGLPEVKVGVFLAQLDWLLQRLLDKSPAAIRRGLYTMKRIESMGFEEAMAFTESQIAPFTLTEDAREGQQAFQQKRKPQWKGR